MPSMDRWDAPADIIVSDATAVTGDGIDQPTTLANRRRRERLDLRFGGLFTVTVPGVAGLNNRGSLLGAVSRIKYKVGGKPIVDIDARCARALGEFFAQQNPPAVRAADALVQANTPLSETVPLWFSSPQSLNLGETKYLDPPGENLKIELAITPSRRANLPGILAGVAGQGTLAQLTCQVQDVYDEDVTQLPDERVWVDEIVTPVIAAAQGNYRVDLKLNRKVRGILIQQDSDNGEVGGGGLIKNFTLKTDRAILYNNINWNNFVEHLAQEFGAAAQDTRAYAFIDFQRQGRRSTWLDPVNEDTGLRFEFNVTPAGLTNPVIRIVPVQYERVVGATADVTRLEQARGRGRGAAAPLGVIAR